MSRHGTWKAARPMRLAMLTEMPRLPLSMPETMFRLMPGLSATAACVRPCMRPPALHREGGRCCLQGSKKGGLERSP